MTVLLYILLSIALGFIYTEVVGYLLHILLHSNKVAFLSRGHMIHHIKLYGPEIMQITPEYDCSVKTRWGFLKVGIEWVLPIGSVTGLTLLLGWLLSVPTLYLLVFLGTALIWGFILFDYMHDGMHMQTFSFKIPFMNKWFKAIRVLHINHHVNLSDDGRMDTNFGICFFFVDRIFGSYETETKPFNEKGFEAMKERYSYIYDIQE